MDIDDFMDINQPIRRYVIPDNSLEFRREPLPSSILDLEPRERQGTEFSKTLRNAQDSELVDTFRGLSVAARHRFGRRSNMDNITSDNTDTESLCGVGGIEDFVHEEQMRMQNDIYERYAFNPRPFNPQLPIHKYKSEILRRIRDSPVIVIEGETGCGKSTQVPQFILDDCYQNNAYCNIVVTQPRRIAAVSLAEQVSRERGYDKHTVVGYQIGLDRKTSDDTRLLYCTTGVLLEKLIKNKQMDMYTHIVLDEIHERDEDMEFLLIAIKRFMIRNPFDTKIILMSATIDTKQFSSYFRLPTPRGDFLKAPILKIPGKRQYQISTYYLDNLDTIHGMSAFEGVETPRITDKMYRVARSIVISFNSPQYTDDGICFLMFLPGIHEIIQMHQLMVEERNRLAHSNSNINMIILPLHSIISSAEQKDVFRDVRPNEIKIILATNIAESSITVPDVKFVIDFCLTRTLEVDSETGFSVLRLNWASKTSCVQRSGRAGRTCAGRVYRLVPKDFYKHRLPENDTPALVRCALEKIVLKAKKLDPNVAPSKIIGLAIEPPDLTDINVTILKLKEARGLHFKVGKSYASDDGDLTFMGSIMEALPLDILATRLIVMGYMFNALDDCIIMAAGLTVQKVFAHNFQNPLKTYVQKLAFANGSGSDLFAILHAFRYAEVRIKTQESKFIGGAGRYNLDVKGIYEMYHLVEEIRGRLKTFKIQTPEGVNQFTMSDKNRMMITKVCIAGAFYPNYFLRNSCLSNEDRERQIFHDLNGRDPTNTIYYKGISTDEMGFLYEDQVKQYFKQRDVIKSKDDIVVSFDEGSHKMFVTFKDKQDFTNSRLSKDVLPGNIKTQVYKAIKLARERDPLRLRILDKERMYKYAESIGLGKYERGLFVYANKTVRPFAEKLCCIPRLKDKQIEGYIINIETPNRFWIHCSQDDIVLKAINKKIPLADRYPLQSVENIIGKKVAVQIDGTFYRAQVKSSVNDNVSSKFKVFCFDEGTEYDVEASQLRSIDNIEIDGRLLRLGRDIKMVPLADIPPRVIEASLAEICPSYLASPMGQWTSEAIDEFKSLVKDHIYTIEIYSFWNGVCSVTIYGHNGKTINEEMVERKLAETCEECYPSKYDHSLRYRAQNFSSPDDTHAYQEIIDYLKEFYRVPVKPPPITICSKAVQLRGPVSPLETTIYSTIRSGYTKCMQIERFSVNSVFMDTDSHDPTERLVVAATCGTNEAGNGLILRNTTVMPNIRGFGTLMAMLFAPVVEVHPDGECTRYNSLLCGLGYNPKRGKGFYEEHDLIMNIDCSLDQQDMLIINKMRYTMSAILHTNENELIPNNPEINILTLQKSLIKDLLEFVEKPRPLHDIRPLGANDHRWGLHPSYKMYEVTGTNIYGDRATFPSFSFVGLKEKTFKQMEDFRKNNERLHKIAFCNEQLGVEVKCLLCSKLLITVPEVQIHLFTKIHKDRTQEYDAEFDAVKCMPVTKQILHESFLNASFY
ncbi:probable ATP-dependent RNA helicase spindle-E [Culicoides brevitarsis]|uniref:probable ATP-dependent RNA helicase spindle-E n=1 Tax=Culicoides brevitarsis TaxID=469753 RepID=UPI00307B9A70